MRRTLAVLVLACALIAVVAVANAGAAGRTAVIKTKSFDTFVPNPANPPNLLDINHLQWTPGIITVHSGEAIKLINSDNSGDPHVLVIALKKDLPRTAAQIDNIFTNKVVREIAPKLLINVNNPNLGFKAYQTNAGPNGLNQEGDSLVITPGGPHKTASWLVSAKAGTTLYYFCAIHPWMQGEIKVVK
ncbi:MAG: hypothetical protein JOZ98_06370 [Solirubrobacterales bacterium]|nr:hypothetical protein [Solirubrobacterales bacterium]MBV9422514.1 hypothetical protein [Solirubrobacterales bacterium]MBV9799447.1 hypothetical protein [Solirubrobacterales bacterium]